jgi:hypothetical protein
LRRKVLAGVAVALAAAGLTAVSTAATSSGGAAVGGSGTLIGAPPGRSASYPAAQARDVANIRGATIPLPAGGTFNGVRWELVAGEVTSATMDGVLQYNAACQWLRAWRDGRDAALAVKILQAIPSWTALRGTDSGAYIAQVAAQAIHGGGELTTQMLTGCDASHAREVDYATTLGLAPSS